MFWIIVGCMLAATLFGSVFTRYLDARPTTAVGEPSFNSNYCFRITQLTALASVALVALAILILASADPSGSRCPDWNIVLTNGTTMSPGPVMLICVAAAIWPCIVAVHWRHFAQRISDQIEQSPHRLLLSLSGLSEQPKLDFNRLYLVVSIGWCLFCSMPLWMMLGGCTRLFG
jgi:hypothetical protein